MGIGMKNREKRKERIFVIIVTYIQLGFNDLCWYQFKAHRMGVLPPYNKGLGTCSFSYFL